MAVKKVKGPTFQVFARRVTILSVEITGVRPCRKHMRQG